MFVVVTGEIGESKAEQPIILELVSRKITDKKLNGDYNVRSLWQLFNYWGNDYSIMEPSDSMTLDRKQYNAMLFV